MFEDCSTAYGGFPSERGYLTPWIVAHTVVISERLLVVAGQSRCSGDW